VCSWAIRSAKFSRILENASMLGSNFWSEAIDDYGLWAELYNREPNGSRATSNRTTRPKGSVAELLFSASSFRILPEDSGKCATSSPSGISILVYQEHGMHGKQPTCLGIPDHHPEIRILDRMIPSPFESTTKAQLRRILFVLGFKVWQPSLRFGSSKVQRMRSGGEV
jgi:hypothetical protein